jgi:hypothetical protein
MQQQYAPLMAQQAQELQQQYEPEAYAARQALGGVIGQEGYLTDYQAPQGTGFEATRRRLQQDIRGGLAGRGFAAATDPYTEAEELSRFEFPYQLQREQLATQELGRRQQLAAGLAGRYAPPAIAGVSTPQVQAPQVGTPNLMQGYNFGSVQQGIQQGYGNYLNAFSARQNMLAQGQMNQYNQQMGLLGAGLGMAGNLAGIGLIGGLGAFGS